MIKKNKYRTKIIIKLHVWEVYKIGKKLNFVSISWKTKKITFYHVIKENHKKKKKMLNEN